MKKTTILLGMLSVSFAYAQQAGDPTGKVGVNTNTPTETLEVKGTVKVQDLPTEGQNKVYNGQATKNGAFTPKKTVVADDNGVLGVVENIVEAGSATNTALRWDDNDKKWKAVTPGATSGNIYTVDGNIPAGTNRMVTLDNPSGSAVGAKLNFVLPTGTNKTFNIIQPTGVQGFSLSTKEAGQKQNLINFFDNATTRKAYLGFTEADTENNFRFKNEAGGKIFLENEVKIGTIPTHSSATEVLVDNNGVISKKTIASLGTNATLSMSPAANTTSNGGVLTFNNGTAPATTIDLKTLFPWRIYGGDNGSIGKNDRIYHDAIVGIGNFSATAWGQNTNDSNIIQSRLHITRGSEDHIALYDNGDPTHNDQHRFSITTRNQHFYIRKPGQANKNRLLLGSNGSLFLPMGNANLTDDGEGRGFHYDASTGRVGINLGSTSEPDPSQAIDLKGTIRLRETTAVADVNNKLLVTIANGTVHTLAGSTNGQVLTWNNNKWVAQTPTAGVTDNLYTANGTIAAGTNRMVTLADPATGGTAGATLSFTLPNGTNKAFNIIQADGTQGFSLSTKTANQTQNLINFFNNATVRQGYLGFTTDSDFRIKNEKNNGKIFLENEVKIATLNDIGAANNKLLVADANGVVKIINASNGQVLGYNGTKWAPVTSATLSMPQAADATNTSSGGILTFNNNMTTTTIDLKTISPWRIYGSEIGSIGKNDRIYHDAIVGIGDFSDATKWVNGNVNNLIAQSRLNVTKGVEDHIALHPDNGDAHRITFVAKGTHFYIRKPGQTHKNRLLLGDNGSLFLAKSGTELTDAGGGRGFHYDAAKGFVGIGIGAEGVDSDPTSALDVKGNIRMRDIPSFGTVDSVPANADGSARLNSMFQTAEQTNKLLVANGIGAVRALSATNGQVPVYRNNKWVAETINAGGSSPFRVAGGTTPASSSDNTAKIYHNGVVGIGDFSSNQNIALIPAAVTDKRAVKLVVNGAVAAGSFKGTHGANIFPDYVFQKYYTGTSSIKADYTFQSLSQVEDFVKTNGHLPGYKSAADIKAQGYIDVMETQISNVEKIEELYLHTIEQEKALKEKDAKIKALEERLERLEKLIK